jgi:hypothetical protein
VPVQVVEQHRIGPRKLVGLVQVFAAAFERLFADRCAPVALNGGIVRGKQLRRDHTFKLVFRSDAG